MEDESLSTLLCEESEITCVEDDEFGDHSDEVDEHVEILLNKETIFGFKRDRIPVFDNWVKSARLEAVTWILKTRAVFGFNFRTAYLSVTYFDQFLSKKPLDKQRLWVIKLLSVACISLAAKMEELKVPALSEYAMEEYDFESRVIRRMELLVLNTLEWKMTFVTPFSFLRCFTARLNAESPAPEIVSRTIESIFAVMRETSLVNYRASAVAAAAILMTLDQNLTKKALECKLNSSSCSGFLEVEEVFECYNQIQKSQRENLKTQLPRQFRPMEVLEKSSVSATVRNKRKRLTFSPSDQSNTPDKRLR